jgi:hypothetical protein
MLSLGGFAATRFAKRLSLNPFIMAAAYNIARIYSFWYEQSIVHMILGLPG